MQSISDNNQKLIVVLRSLALGDLLTALPAFRTIRNYFPDYKVILTCPIWLKSLAKYLDLADEFIEGAYFYDEKSNKKCFRIPTDMQERIELEKAQLNELHGINDNPYLAINLRGVRNATHQVLLKLSPQKYIGYYNEEIFETIGCPIWDPEEHEVKRWCRLLREMGLQSDPTDLHFEAPIIDLPINDMSYTIIHPGAGSPARFWPTERWSAIAKWETKRGNQVILTGNSSETNLVLKVAAIAGISAESIYVGRDNVLELSAICGRARKILSVDTGIAHLAVALRVPSITLFGPMPPSRWGPPNNLHRHRVLWTGITGEPYSTNPDKGLLKITVENVIEEIIFLEKIGF